MAAKTPVRIVVPGVVKEGLPGDTWLLEHQARLKLPRQPDRLLDLGGIGGGDVGVLGLVAHPERIGRGDRFLLRGIGGAQQGQHLLLGERKGGTQAAVSQGLVDQLAGGGEWMADPVVAIDAIHGPLLGLGYFLSRERVGRVVVFDSAAIG